MPVSASFGKILAAGRAQFNASAAEARRTLPGFDGEAFAAFLQTGVDAVVAAVARVVPDRAAIVAVAAYEIALVLVAKGVVGANKRESLVSRVWTELAPQLSKPISESPTEVLGALSNAALYLEKSGLRGHEWLGNMLALAGKAVVVSDLLRLGQVLAWRAGAAHLRQSAFKAADELPPALALAAVGADGDASWPEVRGRLLADPWWAPKQEEGHLPGQGREIGAFSGLGGTFPQPPVVRTCEAGFQVKSGNRYSLLVADVWGAILCPATEEEFERASAYAGVTLTARFSDELKRKLDLPTEGLTIACNQNTAAVTSPYTFGIRIFPRR